MNVSTNGFSAGRMEEQRSTRSRLVFRTGEYKVVAVSSSVTGPRRLLSVPDSNTGTSARPWPASGITIRPNKNMDTVLNAAGEEYARSIIARLHSSFSSSSYRFGRTRKRISNVVDCEPTRKRSTDVGHSFETEQSAADEFAQCNRPCQTQLIDVE
jgi:hypothetical protein